MRTLKRFLHFCILILVAPPKYKITLLKSGIYSSAQLHQDLFALLQNNFIHNGFFVEYGPNGVIGVGRRPLEKVAA